MCVYVFAMLANLLCTDLALKMLTWNAIGMAVLVIKQHVSASDVAQV